jgi:acetyl esterase
MSTSTSTSTEPTATTEDRVLKTDDRADPRIVTLLGYFGCSGRMPNPLVDPATASLDDMREHCRKAELGIHTVLNMINPDVISRNNVSVSSVIIKGVDGNDITLHIHTPTDVKSSGIPCVYHIHGGGMAYLTAADISYQNWRNSIAARGLLCVGVEFRNSAGKLGPHPFPAGLNDCYTGLQWVNSQRDALGISKVIVSGESGGANLTMAVTLKAKREGVLNFVDGVFAQCPFISGMYGCSNEEKQALLPSLLEFDGYVLTNKGLAITTAVYTPDDKNAYQTNPLAWPFATSAEEMKGFPPHVIVVSELDPLRDEGLAYFRKLLSVGITAASMTLNGVTHGAEVNYYNQIPNVTCLVLDQLTAFSRSL